jgi:hypothetical protein
MKKDIDSFALPAGFRPRKLSKDGGRHSSHKVQTERISNAKDVYRILDAESEQRFNHLKRLSLAGNEDAFLADFDKYRFQPDFVKYLEKRLTGQQIRYSEVPPVPPTLWTIVNCKDLLSPFEEDPVIDIQEDGTGEISSLFLYAIMRNLVLPH